MVDCQCDEVVMNLHRAADREHGRDAMTACLGWRITATRIHPAFDSKLSSDPLEPMNKELPSVGPTSNVIARVACLRSLSLKEESNDNEIENSQEYDKDTVKDIETLLYRCYLGLKRIHF